MRHEGKIFGVGLGRTGTRTLVKALEILGYGPIYHNPKSFEFLQHGDDCQVAIEGATLVDWPALYSLYPDAKFVLTVRSDVEAWIESSKRAMDRYPLDRFTENQVVYRFAVRNRMYRWGCLEFDPEIMKQHYLDHNAQVSNFFRRRGSRDRLLCYNVTYGWEPLCRFLAANVPSDPFPCEQDVERTS